MVKSMVLNTTTKPLKRFKLNIRLEEVELIWAGKEAVLKSVTKISHPVQGQTTRAIRTSITKKSQRHSITDSTVTWLISPHLKCMNQKERTNGVFER